MPQQLIENISILSKVVLSTLVRDRRGFAIWNAVEDTFVCSSGKVKGCKLTLWLDYEHSAAVLDCLRLIEKDLHSSYRSTCCRCTRCSRTLVGCSRVTKPDETHTAFILAPLHNNSRARLNALFFNATRSGVSRLADSLDCASTSIPASMIFRTKVRSESCAAYAKACSALRSVQLPSKGLRLLARIFAPHLISRSKG